MEKKKISPDVNFPRFLTFIDHIHEIFQPKFIHEFIFLWSEILNTHSWQVARGNEWKGFLSNIFFELLFKFENPMDYVSQCQFTENAENRRKMKISKKCFVHTLKLCFAKLCLKFQKKYWKLMPELCTKIKSEIKIDILSKSRLKITYI